VHNLTGKLLFFPLFILYLIWSYPSVLSLEERLNEVNDEARLSTLTATAICRCDYQLVLLLPGPHTGTRPGKRWEIKEALAD
jgi:hypothetical protein